MMLSLRTLKLWPYFYTRWISYLIVWNKHLNSDFTPPNNGILALLYFYTDWILTSSFETLVFCCYCYDHWNSYLVLALQSLEFWPYFDTYLNSHLIHPPFGILVLFFTLWKFWSNLSKHWNSGALLTNIRILL